MDKKALLAEVEKLRASLTGDLMNDMDIRDKMHNIEMKLNGTRPEDSYIECVGCGS